MTRLLGVLLLLVGGLVGSVAFGATPAFACSCARLDDAQKTEWAGAVFTGTITAAHEDAGALRGDEAVRYDVTVDRVFKGEVAAATTRVSTASHSASCGLPDLPEGRAIAFFVGREADGTVQPDTMTVSSCGGTAVLTPELEGAIVAALGEGEPPGAAERSGASDASGPSEVAEPADPSDQADASADGAGDGTPFGIVLLALRIMAVGVIGLVLAGAVAFAVVRLVLRRRRR